MDKTSLKADVSKLPAYACVELPGQGTSIYRITRVAQPLTIDAARRQAEQQQVGNVLAQQEMLAYIEALKLRAKVKVLMQGAVDSTAAEAGKVSK